MKRPHVICHMATSLDGRILPDRWRPAGVHSHRQYETLHEELGGGSWLVGRVTGAEFARRDAYPRTTVVSLDREPWVSAPDADAYAIVLDPHGKIAWGRADVDGDPIVVLLLETVSDAHLAGLREDGVSYVFAGRDGLDLPGALASLASLLGIDRLLLEGGGHLNGSMLREGLVDEVSLIMIPVVDARSGAPALFEGAEDIGGADGLAGVRLMETRVLEGDAVWLRYGLTHSPGGGET